VWRVCQDKNHHRSHGRREFETLTKVVNAVDLVMQRAVMVVMLIAPYCIFLLVTAIFMDLCVGALKALAKYAVTVLLGLLIHSGITLPILLRVIGSYSPILSSP
jgi:Na+/H+-dicarboxylate symporter